MHSNHQFMNKNDKKTARQKYCFQRAVKMFDWMGQSTDKWGFVEVTGLGTGNASVAGSVDSFEQKTRQP